MLNLLSAANSDSLSNTDDPATICSLPKDRGSCEKFELRFYFNSEIGECKYFFFSGCGGNKNNFKELANCQKVCGKRNTQSTITMQIELKINSFLESTSKPSSSELGLAVESSAVTIHSETVTSSVATSTTSSTTTTTTTASTPSSTSNSTPTSTTTTTTTAAPALQSSFPSVSTIQQASSSTAPQSSSSVHSFAPTVISTTAQVVAVSSSAPTIATHPTIPPAQPSPLPPAPPAPLPPVQLAPQPPSISPPSVQKAAVLQPSASQPSIATGLQQPLNSNPPSFGAPGISPPSSGFDFPRITPTIPPGFKGFSSPFLAPEAGAFENSGTPSDFKFPSQIVESAEFIKPNRTYQAGICQQPQDPGPCSSKFIRW